jgi:hypothetical protein
MVDSSSFARHLFLAKSPASASLVASEFEILPRTLWHNLREIGYFIHPTMFLAGEG